ncbi:putative transposase, Ptta/En/Spm, plant [Sesbania bispinosa]|nr:putative transposase, Ptta/En/Spm, plant [Sesbania bispinosa]
MTIPETHFKQLMAYWGNSTIQNISKKNAINRAKQKYVHRTGPINFPRIRAKLHEKKNDGEEVTQAEMFIETHKSRKGKEVDEQTQFAIRWLT